MLTAGPSERAPGQASALVPVSAAGPDPELLRRRRRQWPLPAVTVGRPVSVEGLRRASVLRRRLLLLQLVSNKRPVAARRTWRSAFGRGDSGLDLADPHSRRPGAQRRSGAEAPDCTGSGLRERRWDAEPAAGSWPAERRPCSAIAAAVDASAGASGAGRQRSRLHRPACPGTATASGASSAGAAAGRPGTRASTRRRLPASSAFYLTLSLTFSKAELQVLNRLDYYSEKITLTSVG